MRSDRFFVVTGASGSGKSSLLAALSEVGYSTVPEVGRAIVREQVAIEGRILPWIDQPAFMEAVLNHNIRDYRVALTMESPVFFDRGVPECLAWARLLGVGIQVHHREAVARYRYNPLVFVTEPWPEIYTRDAERRESFEKAARSYEPTVAAYVEAGYRLCVVPKAPVSERVQFLLHHVGDDA